MTERGDGYVFVRGSRWWFSFSFRGEKQRGPALVWDKSLKRSRPAKDAAEARRALDAKRREVEQRGAGIQIERVTVNGVLDGWVAFQETRDVRSLWLIKIHIKPVRRAFGSWRVTQLTTAALTTFQKDRLDAGKAPATVNRELEPLRTALRWAARQTPPMVASVPTIPMLPVDNARTGYFTIAEVEALTEQIPDSDIVDFVWWGFRTGQRRGEITGLEWSMLDRSGETWVLRVPASICKNKDGRTIGLGPDERAILERRVAARRLECPYIFHRDGRRMGPFETVWRRALAGAGLPTGRLFHDFRRSAVRHLVKAGVPEKIARQVSGHKTRAMFDRYAIFNEEDTAAALAQVSSYLAAQPKVRNVATMAKAANGPAGPERAQKGHNRQLSPHKHWCARWDSNPEPRA